MAPATRSPALRWHRIGAKVSHSELEDFEAIRSNLYDVRRTVVHIKGSSFTEHVEVARGHIDTEYFMKHLQASPEQVRLIRDIHDLVASPGASTYMADGSANGKPVLLFRDAGGHITTAYEGLKYGPVMGWVQLYKMMHSVLPTLAHAESQGVVHRDLRPQHIMQSGIHPTNLSEYTIIDWEDAVIIPRLSHLLQAGMISPTCGAKGFTAPEMRALRKKGDAASIIDILAATTSKLDVYSLGASLYQLVTGYCPPKDTRGGLSWPPAFPAAWPHLQQLKQLVQDCLRHDPRDRPTFSQILSSHATWLAPFGEQHFKAEGTPEGRAVYQHHCALQSISLRPFYTTLKQQQPSLYRQQRAWCSRAARADPRTKSVHKALHNVRSAWSRAVSWGTHTTGNLLSKISSARSARAATSVATCTSPSSATQATPMTTFSTLTADYASTISDPPPSSFHPTSALHHHAPAGHHPDACSTKLSAAFSAADAAGEACGSPPSAPLIASGLIGSCQVPEECEGGWAVSESGAAAAMVGCFGRSRSIGQGLDGLLLLPMASAWEAAKLGSPSAAAAAGRGHSWRQAAAREEVF